MTLYHFSASHRTREKALHLRNPYSEHRSDKYSDKERHMNCNITAHGDRKSEVEIVIPVLRFHGTGIPVDRRTNKTNTTTTKNKNTKYTGTYTGNHKRMIVIIK